VHWRLAFSRLWLRTKAKCHCRDEEVRHIIALTVTAASIPGTFSSAAEQWAAVRRRDQEADGVFWYGVRTTGTYCRPSCKARSPRQHNVRFFSSQAAAREAGFRPCGRCRPDGTTLLEQQVAAVAAACRLIRTAEDMPNLDDLAESAGMSRFHFHHVFKELMGMTPKAYAAAYRAQRVREELGQSATVTEAIYEAGFNSNGRFYENAPSLLGMSPKAYRTGGSGASVRFAACSCWLGSVLVAATTQGVCAILLGNDTEGLIADLQGRFPNAQFVSGDAQFAECVAAAVAAAELPFRHLDLAVDILSTAFQQCVWQALLDLPPESTAS